MEQTLISIDPYALVTAVVCSVGYLWWRNRPEPKVEREYIAVGVPGLCSNSDERVPVLQGWELEDVTHGDWAIFSREVK